MKYLNILAVLLCLTLLQCGVASKTPFVPEDNPVRFDAAIGDWEFEVSHDPDKKIGFKEYLDQHRDEHSKPTLVSIHHVDGFDYQFDICEKGCDNFSLHFIKLGETMYASFRAMPNGTPNTNFGKFYAPDLYGVAKIETTCACVIRFRTIGKRGVKPPTIKLLITEETIPQDVTRYFTAVPEQLLAETERLNYWEDTYYLSNKDKGACAPIFGIAPGVFFLPGASIGSGWNMDDERGLAFGAEISATYFFGGFAGFGPWTGGYLNMLYDTGTESTRSSVGPEIGWGPVGMDGGYVLDLAGGTARHGVQIRGVFSLSIIQGFVRFGYIQEYGPDIAGGMLFKYPLRLTNDRE
ncbi:MAG: hypothetical protein ABIB04_05200 [Patescibacteria group bacterium]